MLHEQPLRAPRFTLIWTIVAAGQASTLLLPVAGLAVDRFGPRPMALTGITLCGAACIAAAALPHGLVQVILYPVFLLGVLIGTYTPAIVAINRWFHDRKALAIAVTFFAVGAIELLLSKAVPLPEGSATVMSFGLLVLILGLPAAAILRVPAGIAERAGDGDHISGAGNPRWDDGEPTVDYGWREAIKTRDFWLLVVGAAGVGTVDQLIRTLIFSVADNRFHVEGSYETFEGLHGIVAVPFILVGAIVSMKVGLRSALLAFAALHLAALVVILIANGMGWLYAGILILSAGHGGGIALGVSAVGTYFGRRRFATILGTRGLVVGAIQGGIFGLIFATRPWLNFMGVSIDGIWVLVAALIPAAAGVAAYWKLGDPKPALSQIQQVAGD